MDPVPDDAVALEFLASGRVPGVETPTVDERVAFLRTCLRSSAFKEKAWPHFVCFVDASNVARRRPVPVHEVNTPRARLEDLDLVVDALRKLRYVPFVVSDANLFHLMDDPYAYKKKYTEYPHSVASGMQADTIMLRALRKLPEAACVTNDRFSKHLEVQEWGDVLALPRTFFRHRWDGDAVRFEAPDASPMPGALRRLAARWPTS